MLEAESHYLSGTATKMKADATKGYADFCMMLGKTPKAIAVHHNSVRQFKYDGGTEYAPPEFIEYLKRLNTIRQTTCANSPEQNGMSESVWWRLKV